MAQTRSESPRHTDPRAPSARPGDGAPSLHDIDAANDPAGAEPMDLAAQIDSLLNEIEQASAAADPWGDATQRAADKLKDDEERTLEPSQKLLAKVREGVAEMPPEAVAQSESDSGAGVEDAAAAPVEATASVAAATASAGFSPEVADASDVAAAAEIAAAPEPDLLAEALDAVLNESLGTVAEPSAEGVAAQVEASPEEAGTSETSLAAELDAALKEAGDALEQIVPPEDPPAEASAAAAVEVGAAGVVDKAQPTAPTAAAEPAAAAHWTNSGAGGAPKPVAAAAVDVPAETPASTEAAEATVDADDLDAALAEQAEELEESSRAAQAPAPAMAPAEAPPSGDGEAAAPVGEQPGVGAEPHSTASAAAVPAETAHATQQSTVTAAANKTTTAAAHATVRADANAPVVVPEAKPAKVPVPAKPSLWARVRAPIDRLGNVLAMPLAMLPESARDIIAYLAAVTVFNAMAVWTYMLFIYTPVVAPPAHDAPALHATEPVPQAHGEHGDGHGPAAQGANGHGDAKADGHGKATDDGHGEKAETAHVPEHGAKTAHGAESEEAAHGEGAGHGAPHEAEPH